MIRRDPKHRPAARQAAGAALAVLALLLAAAGVWWRRELVENPLAGLLLAAGLVLLGAGWWIWRNYSLVKPLTEAPREPAWRRLEALVEAVFRPAGYDILEGAMVDEAGTAWTLLRDHYGVSVTVQYLELDPGASPVAVDRLRELVARMSRQEAPKGLSLTTGSFSAEAEAFARKYNILIRDGDQLLELVHRSAREALEAAGFAEGCPACGSPLGPDPQSPGRLRCGNPQCRMAGTADELERERQARRDLTISCYSCGRPVRIEPGMGGLVECPYEDCSWVINIENELLALKGGLDRKSTERLAEVTCPKCGRVLRVPADARGLIECPCAERWVIDLGAALGDRPEAQLAETVPAAGGTAAAPSPPAPPAAAPVAAAPRGGGSLSTGGLLLILALLVGVFLVFVYFIIS